MDAKFWQQAAQVLQQRIKLRDLFKALGLAGSGASPELQKLLEAVNGFIAAMDSPAAKEVEAKLAAQVKAAMDKTEPIINLAQLPWFTDLAAILSDKAIKAAIDGAGIALADLDQERRRLEQKLQKPLSWLEFASTYNPETGRRKQSYLEKYLKSTRLQAARKKRSEQAQEGKETEYDNHGNAAVTRLALDMLSYSGNLPAYKYREEKDRNVSVKIKRDAVIRTARKPQKNADPIETVTGVTIHGLDKLAGRYNKGLYKAFMFIMMQVNRQAYTGGELVKDTITITERDLVTHGLYKNTDAAYIGFNDAWDSMLSQLEFLTYQVQGEKIRRSHKQGVVFTTKFYDKKTSTYTIRLNPDLDWQSVFEYFTILPKYFFRLPLNGARLLQLVFDQARRDAAGVKRYGRAVVRMETVQKRLALPGVGDTTHPARDIMQAIEAAVEAIEEKEHEQHPESPLLLFKLKDAAGVDIDMSNALAVKDFLRGKIEIELRGRYLDRLTEVAQDKAKKIAAKQKRTEKIVDAAKAKALARQLNEATE